MYLFRLISFVPFVCLCLWHFWKKYSFCVTYWCSLRVPQLLILFHVLVLTPFQRNLIWWISINVKKSVRFVRPSVSTRFANTNSVRFWFLDILGILVFWNFGILELWYLVFLGILVFYEIWYSRTFTFLVFWEIWYFRTLVSSVSCYFR